MHLRAASPAGHFTMPSTLKPREKWDVQKYTHSTKTTFAMSHQTSKSPHYNLLLSGFHPSLSLSLFSSLPPSFPLMSPFGLPLAGYPASARCHVFRFQILSAFSLPAANR
jgi:hypothetical protein